VNTREGEAGEVESGEIACRVPMRLFNSTQYDIISTAKDQMTFLKAFFSGYFFQKKD